MNYLCFSCLRSVPECDIVYSIKDFSNEHDIAICRSCFRLGIRSVHCNSIPSYEFLSDDKIILDKNRKAVVFPFFRQLFVR